MSDVTSMGKINFDVSEKTAKNIADPDWFVIFSSPIISIKCIFLSVA